MTLPSNHDVKYVVQCGVGSNGISFGEVGVGS